MIKNDRQFGIIKGRVKRLRQLEAELLVRTSDESSDRARTELELRAVRAEIQRMQDDLDDYESLKAGGDVGVAQRVDDLPRLLIRARVAAGLGQAELAERLGVKPQQIQRYEATDYESASLSRLIEVARTLDLTLSPSLESLPDQPRALSALGALGLDRAFLERRLGVSTKDEPNAGLMALSLASHIFSARPERLLEGDPLAIAEPLQPAAYKKPRRASERRAAALSGYARYLSRVIARGLSEESSLVSADPLELQAQILEDGEAVTFETTLRTVWRAGIAVLPLDEGGGFQAAYWRIDNRDIIVINSTSAFESLWLFYLLHEVGHVAERHDETGLIESEPGRDKTVDPRREDQANEFATEVILGGRSQELFELARDRTRGSLALLQRAVRWVARSNNVDVGTLAFNVAHRLGREGEDWWGAATALQQADGNPWRVARDMLVEELDWAALEPLDVELLARAIDVSPGLALSGPPS